MDASQFLKGKLGKMLRPDVANVPKGGGIMTDLPCAKQPPGPPAVIPLRASIAACPKPLAAAAQALPNEMACADPGRKLNWVPGVVWVQPTEAAIVVAFVKSPAQNGIEFWLDLKSLTLPKKSQCSPRAAGMLFVSLVPE